jgi:hypothetical protein
MLHGIHKRTSNKKCEQSLATLTIPNVQVERDVERGIEREREREREREKERKRDRERERKREDEETGSTPD